MSESFEAYAARRRAAFFEARAAEERRRAQGDGPAVPAGSEGPAVDRYEARAAYWRAEVARETTARPGLASPRDV